MNNERSFHSCFQTRLISRFFIEKCDYRREDTRRNGDQREIDEIVLKQKLHMNDIREEVNCYDEKRMYYVYPRRYISKEDVTSRLGTHKCIENVTTSRDQE